MNHNRTKGVVTNDLIIAIYNTEKKELIGVFDSLTILNKYLFGGELNGASKLQFALHNKGRTKSPLFPFKIAVRCATDSQKDLVKESSVFISEGYPPMAEHRTRGYVSSELYFQQTFKIKNKKSTYEPICNARNKARVYEANNPPRNTVLSGLCL